MGRIHLATSLAVLFFAAGIAFAAEPAKPDALIDLNLAGLDLTAAVEALSAQSGAVFVVDARPRELGPNIALTDVPLTKAIDIIAIAYGVCVDTRRAVTFFRFCRARFAQHGLTPPSPQRSSRGAALLGVEISTGPVRDRAATGLGAVVLRVLPGSVASTAGLQPGDTILSVAGRSVANGQELRDAVDAVQLGSSVALEILRDGQRETLTAQF